MVDGDGCGDNGGGDDMIHERVAVG
jgi:hypothetical protein